MGELRPYVAMWERGLYQALTRHSVVYQMVDRVYGPQVFTFQVRLSDPADLSRVLSLGEQLAMMMGVRAVRVARTLGVINVEVALPRSFQRILPVTAVPMKGRAWVGLGQTGTGTPVHVNLAGNRTCHALISGQTGSGKTLTQQLIAWTLVTNNTPEAVRLLILDGKGGSAWWGFEREAHLITPVVGDPVEAVAALTWCVVEMDKRKRERRSSPRLFVIVDELREILGAGSDVAAESIGRLTAVGREVGVHVVAATQHALVDAVGGSIAKANYTMRLTGLVSSASAAYISTGVRGSGAESLQGNGDFLLIVAGEVHRLQVAMLGGREIGRMARADTPEMDFGKYDPARVLDVTSKADPVDPEHVAVALTGKSINQLQNVLGVGGTKATRVHRFAQVVLAKLKSLDHSIIPSFHHSTRPVFCLCDVE